MKNTSKKKENINNNNKNNNLIIEYEKNISSETEISLNEPKEKKNKNSIQIFNKLYQPISGGSSIISNQIKNEILSETLNCSRTIFDITKRNREVEKLSNQMMMYNNPRLKINDLSRPLYNELNNILINAKKKFQNKVKSQISNFHK